MKNIKSVLFLLFIAIMITACNSNQQNDQALPPTNIASQLTQQAEITPATNTPSPTTTPQSTPTIKIFPTATMLYPPISSTQIVVRTQTAYCYILEIESETYEDGTVVEPGQKFKKVWVLKNTGSCTWEKGTALVFNRGVTFDADATLLLSNDVAPGETYEAGIYLTVPETPGINTGYWMLRTPDNTLFGWGEFGRNPLWAQVIVPGATYTPAK